MPNPTIDELDDLESLLLAAKKYEMEFVIDIHKKGFENREFIQEDPLRLYAIACAGGFEDEAKYVARRVEHLKVVKRSNVGNLRGLTLESYHRLVSFLVERDRGRSQTFSEALIPRERSCKCTPRVVYGRIRRDLDILYLSADEIYLKALEYSSKNCGGTCALEALEVKEFIKRAVENSDTVCDKLMW